MNTDEITDPLFRQAVAAIGTGDITQLEILLADHPKLVKERINLPEEGYFKNPYLIWFVADNPIRLGKLPANILQVLAILIEAVKREGGDTVQAQLDYTLVLVATGRTPRECGAQTDMIDLLIDSGARPGNGDGAIAHGNIDAAKNLIRRGGKLTLPTAVVLGLSTDISQMAPAAGRDEQLAALTAAAFYGKTEIIAYLLSLSVDPNGYPAGDSGFHQHATPLHQAVCSGSLESVKLLVEAGADLYAKDKAYGGTPLGWAIYMPTEEGRDETARARYKLIEDYLISR